jgi:hypothetical protein
MFIISDILQIILLNMNYFLGFLGRPLLGTLRIISWAEGSYKAVGPAYETGFIPAIRSRIFTVGCLKPRFSAISRIVKPSIHLISEIITNRIKKSIEFGKFYLTISIESDRLFNIGWLPVAQ